MREKKNFAQRSKVLASAEERKKYFLVYEGEETEQIYFDAVNEQKDSLGINPLIELVPVMRSYSEVGWSNPKKILDRVLLNLEEDEKKTISYETLLNWIMDYLFDLKVLTTRGVMAKNVWTVLRTACQETIQVRLQDDVSDMEKTCKELLGILAEETEITHVVDDVSKIIKEQAITYAEGLDKICFIIDRDRESFVSHPGNDQYSYVLNKCKDNGFGFYLTNPCFEFWLLLHFDEVMNLDTEQLLENPKVTSKRRYTEQQLRTLMPGFTKSKYDVDALMQRIDKAISNEKQFCEDDQELEYTVGSKIGLLLEELRKQ